MTQDQLNKIFYAEHNQDKIDIIMLSTDRHEVKKQTIYTI